MKKIILTMLSLILIFLNVSVFAQEMKKAEEILRYFPDFPDAH